MEDNPYFKIVPSQPWKPSPLEPNEIHRGDWWSVYLENGRYEFNFVTGQLAGYEKRFPITKEDAEQVIAGELDPQELLRRNGEG